MVTFFRKIRWRLAKDQRFLQYTRYAIGEIVLVVIGILIALQINNWNEERKERIIESDYLREMLEDYETNLNRSDNVVAIIENILPVLTGLLNQSAMKTPTVSVDSLNKAFAEIHNMPTYSSSDRVYNNLIGSGDLKLIRNKELKAQLSYYFETLATLRLVQNTHELELVESFQPYVIDHMDFQAVQIQRVDDYQLPPSVDAHRILEVLKDREFRNIITLKWTIITDLLQQNRKLRDINREIVQLLKQENSNHNTN